jgi:farnesyl-diphosphate farnesyltransferase
MDLDKLLKSNARSLYLSAKILPRSIRKAFYCGYLLCRAADTIADTELIAQQKRLELIKNFPKLIEKRDKKLIAQFKEAVPEKANIRHAEKTLLDNIDLCLKEYVTLGKKHKKMILDVAGAVCRAMEWDLSFFPSEDAGLLKAVPNDDLTIEYCSNMGAEPGAFWARLLLDGKKDEEFLDNAKRIGSALQITNILRDIPEDLRIGRCYLPITDLSFNNLMPQDLLEKKSYKKFRPVIYKWINWGVDNMLAAPYFFDKIAKKRFGARASVAWPVIWSLDTFYLLATAKNLLDKNMRIKIQQKTIYLTMLLSPLFCCSNFIFRLLVNYKALKIKRYIESA